MGIKPLLKYLQRFDVKLRRSMSLLLLRIFPYRLVIWLMDIDPFLRHNEVAKEIKKIPSDDISILDVGGRVNSLAPFLPKVNRPRLTTLNYNFSDLKSSEKADNDVVQGDGASLPFRDNQFDIVTSITVLEHVPREYREAHLRELFRVAKVKLLIYIPLEPDGIEYEKKLYGLSLNDHIRYMTKQHIDNGLPTVEEIRGCFPDCRIRYTQNARVWLTYMVLKQIPFIGIIFPRIIYEVFLRFINNSPPFYEALFIIDKRS